MQLLSLSFLAFAATTFAKVTLTLPMQDQLPQIARVNALYSWSLSPNTFTSSNGGNLEYFMSSSAEWIIFDAATRTFSGTPSPSDEGNPEITLTAKDGSSAASDTFTLCVTRYPPPSLSYSIADQFRSVKNNSALSSVFGLSPHSALATENPTLRIPSAWSFSIGFPGDTFTAENNLFYDVLQADGSPLPSWLQYNSKPFTLNGITPNEKILPSPYKLSLAFHASDQKGYSAIKLPFDLLVASHELSQTTNSLPMINVTAETPFNFSLASSADLTGILIDGQPIQSDNITKLAIDVSPHQWLAYDESKRILSGTPPKDLHNPILQAYIETSFNQSIRTNVSLELVPSFFAASELPPIQLADDGSVFFNLTHYYADASNERGGDVDLSAAFEPSNASGLLVFDANTGILSGRLPSELTSSVTRVTFAAYSHVTHSISHTVLAITTPPWMHKHKGAGIHPSQLSAAARKKLALGLGVTFGVIGGMCLIGAFLAAFRHCARVHDTALGVEANTHAWSEKDRKWYGVDSENGRSISPESKTERETTEGLPRNGLDLQDIFQPPPTVFRRTPDYANLGLGNAPPKPPSVAGSNVMSKREFMTKIKDAVRQVSDQYQRIRRGSPSRPVIGRPVLLTSGKTSASSGPVEDTISYSASVLNSSIISPSSSTVDCSVPRRRADFGPARSPAFSHPPDGETSRPASYGSNDSLASAETHAAEAIVQTATRATSIKSGRTGSGIALDSPQIPPPVRPRIVPFTSSTRVPVPRMPSGQENAGSKSRRIPSQKAQVVHDVEKSASGDDLSLGIQYVRALGADQRTVGTNASVPTMSTNARSSYSSLESSHHGHAGASTQRMLVRAEQKFHFRVPVFLEDSPSTYTKPHSLTARLTSGLPLPKFLRVDLRGNQKGSVEFYGTPTANDISDYEIEICTDDDKCIARVLVEVVARV